MVIFKFGGKSLKNEEKISNVAKYIKQRCQKEKLVVVVSAMADTTDQLIETAKKYSPKPCKRELDAFISCGEALSASLLAIKLCDLGICACSLLGWQAKIFAEGDFGEGKIVSIDKSIIEDKLKKHDCVIVAGFQALGEHGDIVTLGRGGSDTTAVALGAAFGCPVEIYSDFDGIFAGDPRRMKYKKYDCVTYDCADNYAQSGAKVLCKSSVQIAKDANVEVVCKSSEEPSLCGTKLTKIPTAFVGTNIKTDLAQISIVFDSFGEKSIKTMEYLFKNCHFQEISIKNQTISIIIDIKELAKTESELAKINQQI